MHGMKRPSCFIADTYLALLVALLVASVNSFYHVTLEGNWIHGVAGRILPPLWALEKDIYPVLPTQWSCPSKNFLKDLYIDMDSFEAGFRIKNYPFSFKKNWIKSVFHFFIKSNEVTQNCPLSNRQFLS